MGAGLTGIETACELPARLTRYFGDVTPRVILVDHNPHVGSDMGASARPVIEAALSANGVESRLGVRIVAVDEGGATLSTGETLHAATVVWCAGMRANPLTADLGVARDRLGRLPVDDYLRVDGVHDVFAAGDVAAARMDDTHMSVMSCQHGRPMGRFAGYNVVSDYLASPCWRFESLGMSRYWIWDRQARSTPRAGSGKSSRPGPKQKRPRTSSTRSESIHRSTETAMKYWPLPHRRCSHGRAIS